MVIRTVDITIGIAVVALTLLDVVGTLVATRSLQGRWSASRLYYAAGWWAWRGTALRLRSPARRERMLAVFGPLSLLVLLVVWLVGLLLGWALVYLGATAQLRGASTFAGTVYFSGTSLFTLGFGDIVARSTALRLATLIEAASGLGTIALLISYLPALYGAYSRREARLLTLDDPSGDRIPPNRLLILHAQGAHLERLERFFADWELWIAEVLESHVSSPMLAYFRSQFPGQSWITALGVVLDAASLTCGTVAREAQGPAYFAYRRGRRAVIEVARRLGLPTQPGEAITAELVAAAYGILAQAGLPLRPEPEAVAATVAQRHTDGGTLQRLIDHLAAPPGFWGHSAEDGQVVG